MANWSFGDLYDHLRRFVSRQFPGFWAELHERLEDEWRQQFTTVGAVVRDWPESQEAAVQTTEAGESWERPTTRSIGTQTESEERRTVGNQASGPLTREDGSQTDAEMEELGGVWVWVWAPRRGWAAGLPRRDFTVTMPSSNWRQWGAAEQEPEREAEPERASLTDGREGMPEPSCRPESPPGGDRSDEQPRGRREEEPSEERRGEAPPEENREELPTRGEVNPREEAQRGEIPGPRKGGPYTRRGCWNCGSGAHRYSQCSSPRDQPFCYGCGESGYTMKECPGCRQWWDDLGPYHPEHGHDRRRK
ncbi:PREDICTED: uncharacterized protein LOC105449782 [Wasmannia auropunctata]|uniref:uncharacterized protein LOC105449782 n=1 Tax=Wasmannia auropunctata TaxID=64793 RepID=UPI0005EE9D8A|nr:PREDICTED: uncharacterized protein LOC105449782 [Wasmannia auropunctata]